MKAWIPKSLELLKASLEPPKHELNELDWKGEDLQEDELEC